jgi:hypothetical protein
LQKAPDVSGGICRPHAGRERRPSSKGFEISVGLYDLDASKPWVIPEICKKNENIAEDFRRVVDATACRSHPCHVLNPGMEGETMRKIVAFSAFALALGVAAPAFAACAGHSVTAQTTAPDTTQTAQTTVKTTLPSDQGKGG